MGSFINFTHSVVNSSGLERYFVRRIR